MEMLIIGETLRNAYPGGFIGALLIGDLETGDVPDPLGDRRRELESALRDAYGNSERAELTAKEPLKTYVEYYRNFRKTCHVLLQLESVVFKNRNIPKVSPPVEAMFMAELKNQVLTAGHDAGTLVFPVQAEVSRGSERYTLLNGKEAETAAGDMMMRDGSGIISSIIHGPDDRSAINPGTKRVLYTVYAPPGIREGMIARHFGDIRRYVIDFSPDAVTEREEIYEI